MTDPAPLVLQLRITLLETDPPIWRRVFVPDDLNLERLHDVIQAAMGWRDAHLHEFQVGDKTYGDPEVYYEEPGRKLYNDSNLKLQAIRNRDIDRFTYLYDFGDYWMHEVIIEDCVPEDPNQTYPRFLAGERRCPPEDVGGVTGFSNFLRSIADPSDEDYEAMLEWVGGSYDPETLDLRYIELGLENIANRRRPGPRRGRSR